jgi:hypothetical protein
MDRKNTKKSVVVKSKSQRRKKKPEVSTSRPRRTDESKRVKVEDIPDSPDSSSSVKTDEDYAEFLKTYDPQESYPYDSHSGEEEGSQITVESQKKPLKPLKAKDSK